MAERGAGALSDRDRPAGDPEAILRAWLIFFRSPLAFFADRAPSLCTIRSAPPERRIPGGHFSRPHGGIRQYIVFKCIFLSSFSRHPKKMLMAMAINMTSPRFVHRVIHRFCGQAPECPARQGVRFYTSLSTSNGADGDLQKPYLLLPHAHMKHLR